MGHCAHHYSIKLINMLIQILQVHPGFNPHLQDQLGLRVLCHGHPTAIVCPDVGRVNKHW